MSGYPANHPGGSSLLIDMIMPFLFFFLQFVVQSAGQSEVGNSSDPGCYSSFHCGDNVQIRYPFCNSSDSGTSYCGYLNLGIECQGTHPVLKLGGDTYRVSDVRYNTSTIALQDMDLLDSNCPRARHNLTLQEDVPLQQTEADDHLLFFFNCSGNSLLDEYNKLSCLSHSGSNDSYMLLDKSADTTLGMLLRVLCGDVVTSPVLRRAISQLSPSGLVSSFGTVLHQGFELKWQPPTTVECIRCEKAGGNCGYTYNKGVGGYNFICFCGNGTSAGNCSGSGINKKTKKIAIGVGAGAAGFLVASFLCFLLMYRRKRMKARTGSSTLLFRTTSSVPSSSQKDAEMGSTHYPTHLFKYEELSEATDGFSDANELGDGGFGTVYKGKLRDGRIVAVKRLYENNYKRVEQFLNEVAILNRLRHENLVTLYGCTSRHSRELLLVYEYVPNGTVADHLHGHRASEGTLTWTVRLNIAIETATALAYLHAVEPQIIHRDVKTNNILLDNNFHVKVADFGLSRLFPVDATHVSTAPQGTPGYVDPEYHQCYQLTDKSDVYSFGVVLVELVSSKPAVDITRNRYEINLANLAINKIQNGALHELVDPTLEFETDWAARMMIKLVAELAFRCLQAEKELRPSMDDVLVVLQGIRDCHDEADRSGDGHQSATDDMSLLKINVPASPASVMDKWASRTTTPNTSA